MRNSFRRSARTGAECLSPLLRASGGEGWVRGAVAEKQKRPFTPYPLPQASLEERGSDRCALRAQQRRMVESAECLSPLLRASGGEGWVRGAVAERQKHPLT